jgi:tetratricopeptide (TPR) repeat protein
MRHNTSSERTADRGRRLARGRRFLLGLLVGVVGVGAAGLVVQPQITATAAVQPAPSVPADEEPPPVRSAAAQAAFEAGLKLLAAGRPAEAAAALTRLGESAPEDDVAPEALFEAAQLCDEQLGHPEEARRLYGLVAKRYPSSRLVRRAEHRLAQLEAGLRSGAAPLARFQEIVRTTAEGSPERISRLEALLRDEPGFALHDQALYLIGSARLRAGRAQDVAAAAAVFAELRRRDPKSEWTARADQAEAEARLRERRFTEAQKLYERLLARGGPLWTLVGQEGVARSELGARRQLYGYLACAWLLVVLLVQLMGLVRARCPLASLWPPPLEVAYYAPVAGFLVATSLLIKSAGGPLLTALGLIGLGGAALAWLSGASATQRRPTGGLQLVLGVLWRALTVLALSYAVLERLELLDLLIETARNGPDE